jgi:hypothetical protein
VKVIHYFSFFVTCEETFGDEAIQKTNWIASELKLLAKTKIKGLNPSLKIKI